MGFYFDITAPYPGGQSAPYIPEFKPLSPFNDGTTGQGAGQGAGQGLMPNVNWGNNVALFKALSSSLNNSLVISLNAGFSLVVISGIGGLG
ncbi:hypothetical protein [Helicobacter pylori]|uniref:hypothetical protein n=1 Tax=Helicobacter pylori TaxID=210 RepID=UPI0015E68819|nr:hypothetical protein [Helicobacter pylori]